MKNALISILNYLFRLVTLITFSFLIFSCSKYPPTVMDTIDDAGSNKKELLEVLDQYKSNPKDSLKYAAACYLIENMKWHYGTPPIKSKEFWNYFVLEDSLVINHKFYESELNKQVYLEYKSGKKKELLAPIITGFIQGNNYVQDHHILNADFLINTIETSFKTMNSQWNSYLTFDEFCEFILPYRINSEPVYDIREKLNQHYFRSCLMDSINQDTKKVIKKFSDQIHGFWWDWNDLDLVVRDNGFYNIFNWNMNSFGCTEQVIVLGNTLRSVGIPVLHVFTPAWSDMNMGHSWCAYLNKDHKYVLLGSIYSRPNDFDPIVDPIIATTFLAVTYKAQPTSPLFLKSKDEVIPPVFNSACIKNISDKIVETSDVVLPLKKLYKQNRVVYFCHFLHGRWIPISWGTIDGKSKNGKFDKIPTGLIGAPCLYIDGRMELCGPLVKVLSDNKHLAISKDNNLGTLKLYRKFPYKNRMQDFSSELIGAKIEGANSQDFSDATVLSTVKDTLMPYFQDLQFNNTKKFKYYRIISENPKTYIAEIDFLVPEGTPASTEAHLLPVFDAAKYTEKIDYCLKETLISANNDNKAYDDDPLTFTDSKWVGIELNKPMALNTIRVMPRNADNGINKGDVYELLYWDNDWKSHSSKEAVYNYLVFDQVPLNTFYWLRNLSRGKEEQPFFYENGKQIFIKNDFSYTYYAN